MAQRLARRAHNPEVVCSNHTAGILQFARFTETGRQSLVTLNTATLHRRGAEAARRAHNPEVTRSKRVAGIITLRPFTEAALVYTLDTFNRYSSAEERLKTPSSIQ